MRGEVVEQCTTGPKHARKPPAKQNRAVGLRSNRNFRDRPSCTDPAHVTGARSSCYMASVFLRINLSSKKSRIEKYFYARRTKFRSSLKNEKQIAAEGDRAQIELRKRRVQALQGVRQSAEVANYRTKSRIEKRSARATGFKSSSKNERQIEKESGRASKEKSAISFMRHGKALG